MNLFAQLRTLVFLRRIANELKRSNDIAEARLELERPNEYAALKRHKAEPHRVRRPLDISVPTVDSWNKRWAEQHPTVDDDD